MKFLEQVSWPSFESQLSCLARVFVKKDFVVTHAIVHISGKEGDKPRDQVGSRNNQFKQNDLKMYPKRGEFLPHSVEIIKI